MKNKTCGIYLITEKVSRRDVYVGQSIGIEGRWVKHKGKYPADRFDYRILLECPRCDLDFWEQHYIRVLKTHWSEGGENQDWGGQYWPKPEEPLSPATRAKLSAALKGRVRGPLSEETKAKLSEALKGRNHSEEHRAKNSSAQKGKNKGRVRGPMSEEEKSKRSAAQKGRVHSEEHRAKNSAAQKGRVPPNKGKPMSEEQKEKISAARKAQAALKRSAAEAPPALETLFTLETISNQE